MQRIFRPYDYDASLDRSVRVSDVVSPNHLARQLVAFLASQDLSALYALYYPIGVHPYDPRVLLALWLYGYQTGVRSSRQLETAIAERVPFMYLAAGIQPDHSTLAEFRTLVFAYLPTLFDDLLECAQQEGHLTMGTVSHDGTKIHAAASKHRAVSYQRAGELIHDLQRQIEDLLQRAHDDPASLPDALVVADEVALRLARITRLQDARHVLEARAAERYTADLATYTEKLAVRAERARMTGKPGRGKPPVPPTPAPTPTDQYNFTDPDSRIMKNGTNKGFDQHWNCQLTVTHTGRFIVGRRISNHPNDTQEALPTFDTIPATLGTPDAACLDNGYWSATNVADLLALGITPFIAVGKRAHGLNWEAYYATTPTTEPPADASPLVQMAYRLHTPDGRAQYRERKSTVEPVIGIIKEVLGFRQFSVRGDQHVDGEWTLVCLAYNLKRLFTLRGQQRLQQA
jgi:transposase